MEEERSSYDVLMQPFEEELERDQDPDWIPARVIIPRIIDTKFQVNAKYC